MLLTHLKEMISEIQDVRNEEKVLLNLVKSLDISTDQIVLDVGCGYGEKIKLLQSIGINVEGVEINQHIVETNKNNGLECIHVEEFRSSEKQYDVLLMSHIIEHFSPEDLLGFMDFYLDRLKSDGFLVILTPLMSPTFYADFDHIKPYHPTGISMVFCDPEAQVQYYSRHRIRLRDLWFRKSPFKLYFVSKFYLDSGRIYRFPYLIVNIILVILFRLSFGVIGTTDGWIGVYQKQAKPNL